MLIDGLQNIDLQLEGLQPGGDETGRLLLAEFRIFQKETTARILELDALAVALGKARLDALHGEIAGLSKRRTVVTAYEQGRGRRY